MSNKVVDDRIVTLSFNNKEFEKNVSQSINSLENLNKKLNTKAPATALDSINEASKKIDLSGVSNSVNTLQARFSALQVVGVTALANIANQAMNTAKNLATMFTTQPIGAGFAEYETQLNSVQTILANTQSKGTTLEEVNSALDELNTYADKTIYNFTQMTRNIGTFTAAGVDLDKSVTSIKGIANLAAASGSTSLQASTAMYQLSQALAAGRVSLMDWNSVVNAGMGGQLFQDALKRTATNMGKDVDGMIEKYGSFRESLTRGQWLTADVLTETLTQLSGAYTEADLLAQGYSKEQAKEILELAKTAEDAATKVKTFTQLIDTTKEALGSGWTQTFEIIFGDFEEARQLWTSISDVVNNFINNMSNARNNLLSAVFGSKWNDLTKQINDAGIATDEFEEKIKKVAESKGLDVDKLIKDYGSIRFAIDNGKISSEILKETLDDLGFAEEKNAKSTDGMTSALKYYQDAVDEVWKGTYGNGQKRIEALTKAGYDYAEIQSLVNKTIDDHIVNLEDLSEEQLKAKGYTDKEVKALKTLSEAAEESGESVYDMIETMDQPTGRILFFDSLANLLKPISKLLGSVSQAMRDVFDPIDPEKIYNAIKSFNDFTKALVPTDDTVDKLIRTFRGLFSIVSILSNFIGGGLKLVFTVITKVIEKLWEVLGFGRGTILDITAEIGDLIWQFNSAFKVLDPIGRTVEALVDIFFSFASSIAKLVSSVYHLSPIKGIIDSIFGGVGAVAEGAHKFMDKLTASMRSLAQTLDGMKDLTPEELFGKFSELFGQDFIQGFIDGIGAGAQKVFDKVIEFAKNILKFFKDILGIHSPSTEMFDIALNFIQGFINGIVRFAAFAIRAVIDFGASIINAIKSLDFSRILSVIPIGAATIVVLLLRKVVNAFVEGFNGINSVTESAAKFISGLADITQSIDKTVKAFAKVVKAKAFEIRTEGFKNLAISLALIVGSIIALTFIDTEKIKEALSVVILIGVLLAAFAVAINHISTAGLNVSKEGVKLKSVGGTLLSIVLSLTLLAGTLAILGAMSWPAIGKGLAGLIGMMSLLIIFVALFSKFTTGTTADSIKQSRKILRSLALSLILLAVAFKLMGLLSAEDVLTGVIAMGSMLVFVMLLDKIVKKSYSIKNSTEALGKISGAMILLAIAFRIIGGMSPDQLSAGIITLGAFTVFLTILLNVAKFSSTDALAKVGGVALGLSASMILLGVACKIIGSLSIQEFVKGVSAIAVFILLIKSMVSILKIGSEEQIGKVTLTIMSMSVAIGIMAVVAALLGLLSLKHLAKGITAVSILGLVVAAMAYSLKGAQEADKSLRAMVINIVVLAAAAALLSMLDPVKLATGAAAISVMMLAFSVLSKSITSLKMGKGFVANIAIMTLVVSALSGILLLTSSIPVQGSIQNAIAMSVLLTALVGAITILGKAKSISKQMITTLLVMVGTVGALGLLLGALNALNLTVSIETAISLSLLLVALSGCAVVLGTFGAKTQGAVAGAIGLLEIMGILAAVAVGLGVIVSLIPQLQDFMNKGFSVLSDFALGLGEVLGSFVGGLLEGISNALPGIGSNLSKFMENLSGFIEDTNAIDPAKMQGVKALAEAILILTGAELLDGIMNFFGGGIDFEKFGEDLKNLGKAIKTFAATMDKGDFDPDALTLGADSLKKIAEALKEIPKEGGFVGFFTGGIDFDKFKQDLPDLGEALTDFSTNVAGIETNQASLNSAINVAKALAEIANSLGNEGGIISWFTGDSISLSSFASGISSLGLGLLAYATATKKLEYTDGVKASLAIASDLAELAELLPEDAPFWGLFGGDKLSLGEFGNNLQDLGDGLCNFAESVAEIDSFDKVTKAATTIYSMSNTLKNLDGLGTEGVAAFKNSINLLAQTDLDSFVNNFSGTSFDKFTSIGTELANSLRSGFDSVSGTLTESFISIIDTVLETMREKYERFKTIGSTLVVRIKEGIDSQNTDENSVESKFDSIVDDSKTTVRNYYQDFYDAGAYLVKGFASGVELNSYLAKNAAGYMAQQVVDRVRNVLDEHSPSRVGYELGDYFGMPFVDAISNWIKPAGLAAGSLGNSAKDSLSNTLSKISTLMDMNIDNEPTIRPVIDLSGVTEGADAINGLLSSRTYAGSINLANNIGSRLNQNGRNSDILSALNSLGKILSNSPRGDSYNINGITYSGDSDIATAIQTLVRAAKIDGRS